MTDTLTTGSELSVAASSSGPASIIPLSTTRAMGLYADFNTFLLKAVILDVSVLVVSKGTAVTVDATETNVQETRNDFCFNTATEACAVYRVDIGASSDIRARILSVSGTTITAETALSIETGVSTASVSISQLAEDKYICLLTKPAPTDETTAFVITQSGVTLTDQTPLQLESASVNSPCEVLALSATRAFAMYHITGSQVRISLLNISGNTVTEIDDVTMEASSEFSTHRKKAMAKLSSTHAVIAYAISGAAKLRVLEDATSSITAGTTFTPSSLADDHYLADFDSARFIVSSASGNNEIQTCDVSGTTITQQGNEVAMPNTPDFALLTYLGGSKWLSISRKSDAVEAFAFSSSPDAFTYTHSSAGIPGSII